MSIDPQHLQACIELIEQRIGLSRATQTRIGIAQLLSQISHEGYPHLLDDLRSNSEYEPVWQRLIHSLTIGETYFLRDQRHFRILRESILPELVQTKRQQNEHSLRLWCAGCATGEEAYSLAITLYEALPDIHDWDLHLIGTDINRRAIERARLGRYGDWSFRRVPDGFLARYFNARGDDSYEVIPAIRAMVRFQVDNVLTGIPLAQSDIVFGRHLLIYFSKRQTNHAEMMFHRALAAGGWLFLGQAEALHSDRQQWVTHIFPGNAIYQKPASQAPREDGGVRYGTVSPTENWTPASPTASAEYDAAVQAIHEDRHQQAEVHLAQLLSEQPYHARGHTLLAFLFANRKAYPEAEAHIDEALRKDPLLADAHYIRAIIQMEQGQRQQAIKALNSALFCGRDHALAAFTLGNIYVQMGEPEQAQRTWENGLRALSVGSAERYVSDLSDMTAKTLITLLEANLAGIKKR